VGQQATGMDHSDPNPKIETESGLPNDSSQFENEDLFPCQLCPGARVTDAADAPFLASARTNCALIVKLNTLL